MKTVVPDVQGPEAVVSDCLATWETGKAQPTGCGQVDLFRRRHEQAIEAAQRAIGVDPNYADAYALLAWTLNYAGRPGKALSALAKAMRLNPRPPASYLEILGEILFVQGRYGESASTFQRVLNINPGYARARMWNVAALARADATDGAG